MPRPSDASRRRGVGAALIATAVLLAANGLAGCGADEGRTALAVESASWNDADALVLELECAELDEVDLEPGAGVDGLPLLTAWGEPKLGRCTTTVIVEVPPGTTRIDDAATGMVVDLPPRPA